MRKASGKKKDRMENNEHCSHPKKEATVHRVDYSGLADQRKIADNCRAKSSWGGGLAGMNPRISRAKFPKKQQTRGEGRWSSTGAM